MHHEIDAQVNASVKLLARTFKPELHDRIFRRAEPRLSVPDRLFFAGREEDLERARDAFYIVRVDLRRLVRVVGKRRKLPCAGKPRSVSAGAAKEKGFLFEKSLYRTS